MTQQQYAPTPDANDVLMGGGGAPTAKFEQIGTTIGGRIVAPPRAHQEREYNPTNPGQGALKTFPSGDPIYGLTVDVQTTLRDPSNAEDDGVRRIYVEGKRLKEAVRDAVRSAGGEKLEVGGELYVSFTGLGEAASATVNPPKLYAARYIPAAQAPVMGGQPPAAPPVQQPVAQQNPYAGAPTWAQPQPAAPVAVVQPVQPVQPVQTAPAQNGPTPEQIAAVRAAGQDPALIWPGFTG